MKPNRFKYVKPRSLDEAFDLLAQYGEGARVLAGGQSLMAGLGMRLATPDVLVDINGIDGLAEISTQDDEVVVGALTRHVQVLESPIVARHLPLLAEAITHVGHMGVRNRGTFGGSLGYADPAAELPACVVAHGATIVLGSRNGRRRVAADDFFLGIMHTALEPGELILEIRLPKQRDSQRHVFGELSRRHGDFALVGLAGLISLAGARIAQARIVFFGCVSHASVARATSEALIGQSLPLQSVEELEAMLREDLSPDEVPGMRPETKLNLAAVIARRTLNNLKEGQ